MGIGSASLCGNGNDVGRMKKPAWALNEKWERWYGDGREWKLGTHSYSPILQSTTIPPLYQG